jgi:hypothetical protein
VRIINTQAKTLGSDASAKSNCTPGGVVPLIALFAVGMAIAIRETLTYV